MKISARDENLQPDRSNLSSCPVPSMSSAQTYGHFWIDIMGEIEYPIYASSVLTSSQFEERIIIDLFYSTISHKSNRIFLDEFF